MGSRRQDVDVELMILEPSSARAYIKSLVTTARHKDFDQMNDADILESAALVHKEELRNAERELQRIRGFGFHEH